MTSAAAGPGRATNGNTSNAAPALTMFMPASATSRSPLALTSACHEECSSAAPSTAAATSGSIRLRGAPLGDATREARLPGLGLADERREPPAVEHRVLRPLRGGRVFVRR